MSIALLHALEAIPAPISVSPSMTTRISRLPNRPSNRRRKVFPIGVPTRSLYQLRSLDSIRESPSNQRMSARSHRAIMMVSEVQKGLTPVSQVADLRRLL